MYLLDQQLVGILIVFLLVMLVIVKQITTGYILDKPKGGRFDCVLHLSCLDSFANSRRRKGITKKVR
jgi:hypothetical protein